jgi:hypothetical protein
MVTPDVYISLDIEADGPIPGPYSMLSFGLAVAGRFDGDVFVPANPTERTLYRELQPISEFYDDAALEVARLDRDALRESGLEPAVAMRDAVKWLDGVAEDGHLVLTGFPLLFDWMFFYWYLRQFSSDPPISFSSGLDMKTMYQQRARVCLGATGKEDLPDELRSRRTHTHNALDDAIEQADIFIKLFDWKP